MSIKVMSAVWERSQHAGTELLMLLALADFSDDRGSSYPGVTALAEKCRMKARNTNYILATLQKSGELQVLVNEGPKGTNRYRIVLEALGGLQGVAGVGMQQSAGAQITAGLQSSVGTPAMQCAKPLQPIAAEPSLNRQEPSSKARRVRSAVAKPVPIELPEWIPSDTWNDFATMRKSIKKPMTDAAVRILVKKLEKLRVDGHDPRAVLEQSIASSWQGLFPLKADDSRRPALDSVDVFEGGR